MPTTNRRQFLKGAAALTTGLMIVPRHVLGGNGYLAPSDQITLGFIGTGRQGKGLGNRFSKLDGFQIVAACDVEKAKLQRFQNEVNQVYGESRGGTPDQVTGYGDFRELIGRDDIDAVVIATPDHWHAVIAIAAMKAGKDVYCEKPLSLTIKEGRAMVNAARKYDRVFQTGSMQRSQEGFWHACELVRNGYLGEISEVKVSVGGPPSPCDLPTETLDPARGMNWDFWLGPAAYRGYHSDLAPPIPEAFWPRWRYYSEFGGGMVTDWGAHMFDIAQWALGMDDTGPVEFIPPNKTEPFMTMRYENGIIMKHEEFGRGNAVRFIGSEGTLDVSRSFLDTTPVSLKDYVIKDTETRLYRSENHYLDFLQAVQNRTKPICDVEIGHRTATVCNVANIAYSLGQTLQWDPEKEKFVGNSEANKMRKRKYRGNWKLK